MWVFATLAAMVLGLVLLARSSLPLIKIAACSFCVAFAGMLLLYPGGQLKSAAEGLGMVEVLGFALFMPAGYVLSAALGGMALRAIGTRRRDRT